MKDREEKPDETLHVWEFLRAAKDHTVYDVLELSIRKERLARLIFEVMDVGKLAAKVFIMMYLHRRVWTGPELAKVLKSHRQNVNTELHKLKNEGYVERISLHKWRISSRFTSLPEM